VKSKTPPHAPPPRSGPPCTYFAEVLPHPTRARGGACRAGGEALRPSPTPCPCFRVRAPLRSPLRPYAVVAPRPRVGVCGGDVGRCDPVSRDVPTCGVDVCVRALVWGRCGASVGVGGVSVWGCGVDVGRCGVGVGGGGRGV